jgi:valyl-tRNA synthetase
LHPFMPFMTEEAWSYIPHKEDGLIIAKWPTVDERYIDDNAESEMAIFMDLVRDVRNVRKEYNVDPAKRIKALIAPASRRELMNRYGYIFGRLCNVPEISIMSDGQEVPANSASMMANDVTLYLPLEGMLDIQAECQRLNKEKSGLVEQIAKLNDKLNNEAFVGKAPVQVVQKERERLAEYQATLKQIEDRMSALCG